MARLAKELRFETTFSSYAAVEICGEGGSGVVYAATDKDGNQFAIKCLRPQYVTTDKLRRFKNELRFCFQNQHANIVCIVDYGHIELNGEKVPFFVMPFCRETLRSLMKIGIAHDKVLPYFSQILNGVEAAHLKGIWHRDLKPENILVEQTNGELLVADFGIAHFSEDELYTLEVIS